MPCKIGLKMLFKQKGKTKYEQEQAGKNVSNCIGLPFTILTVYFDRWNNN